MRHHAILLATLLVAASAPAATAQSLFKCTAPDGRVTYQETPCTGERSQRRLDNPRPPSPDEVQARRMLENEAMWGDPLADRFAREARDREMARLREREAYAREERLRRQREEASRPAEEIPWVTPWGFPGKPGQARPQAKPTS